MALICVKTSSPGRSSFLTFGHTDSERSSSQGYITGTEGADHRTDRDGHQPVLRARGQGTAKESSSSRNQDAMSTLHVQAFLPDRFLELKLLNRDSWVAESIKLLSDKGHNSVSPDNLAICWFLMYHPVCWEENVLFDKCLVSSSFPITGKFCP